MKTAVVISISIILLGLAAGKEDEAVQQCSKDVSASCPSPWKYTYPVGDPSYCLQGNNKGLLRMEVLPGTGWDNLRNLNMGMVVWKNYSQCLTSEDGKYLIPDNTYVVPLKESNVVLNSEFFDHWNNYSSMTSNSINAEAHASFFGIGLGGKFSKEYESVKKHQVEDKAVTTRVQLRYKFYTVKAQPDMQLHPDFKSRLLDIAANLQCNNTAMARYMADLLVRDYGTHYVTSIDAGAILAKIDHVKSTYAATFNSDKSKITASASASFFGSFGFSASYTHQTETKDLDTYLKNVAHSKIYTYGGPPYRANFSINQWEDGLPNNLVAIDRSGDPLHYTITPEALPELPEFLALDLSRFVLKSIKTYYKHNSIKGCTDASSPNFNFQAVLDDHSCKAPYTNFTFGGVFQNCSISGSPSTNPCGAFQQKNPKKNDYACPDGYNAVLLHQGLTPTTCHRECHGWWIFKSCHNDCGYARYNTYWCVATGSVKDHSGYLFGGLYTKIAMNPVTGTASCPPKLYPQRFGPEGMYVCISDDYELAAQYSLRFAGFFSCSAGNPLAFKKTTAPASGQGLERALYSAGSSSWPKRCPTGYSQHLAIIDEDCEINYCVKANSLSAQGLPTIRRPPFRPLPKMNHNITIPLAIVNDDTGKVWFKDPNSLSWILATKSSVMKFMAETDINKGAIENLKASVDEIKPSTKSSSSSTGPKDDTMSPGTAVVITIAVIAFAAILILVVVVSVRRKTRRESNKSSMNPLLSSSTNYQTVGNVEHE
ncbi:macrophage-expressed gene 1 protein-like isoform X2 [Actinia tenebrosa]|uniref:Macrophage-expressed gene 1 protein-like isoform X2 n=1 Tax=Actinia tenebrosa TaxID=6105 RepID=A0A6P8J164_ACTTE|nr:macrophage-expressed gene 1 protein-like isoform X2 [Actinia tenebrosa]